MKQAQCEQMKQAQCDQMKQRKPNEEGAMKRGERAENVRGESGERAGGGIAREGTFADRKHLLAFLLHFQRRFVAREWGHGQRRLLRCMHMLCA